MNSTVVSLILLLVVLGAAILLQRKQNVASQQRPTSENPYGGLRAMALRKTPKDLKLADSSYSGSFGVLMEIGVGGGTATIVAFIDGNASLYLSSGGGVIGGVGHKNVRDQAIRLTNLSSKYLNQMFRASDYPLPKYGKIRFYCLTDSGVVTTEADEKSLQQKSSEIWPLYYAGQDLLTQIRLTSGN